MAEVKLAQVTKKFAETQVIHPLDLEIKEGEFCVIVGPSGCGKSTLLRMIAGLEGITSGTIHIGNTDVTRVDPAERGVAMVFQTYALYPHMTVAENMGFGLKMNRVAKATIERKVNEAADILKLQPYLARKPKALSGGQRQRVAIGRAIVRDPKVFLFDEPLSNLDAELRVEMRVELARLHKEIGATMVYVTHDQVEAMTLADQIVVLKGGKIEQAGTPMALYAKPENRFVAGFIGSPSMNFINGLGAGKSVRVPALAHKKIPVQVQLPNDVQVVVGIRAQDAQLDTADNTLTVELTEQLGGVSYVYLQSTTNERIIVQTSGDRQFAPGQKVGLKIAAKKLHVFDKHSSTRLHR